MQKTRPKIDFHLEDCLGRLHQCGTIQLDMSLPERFDLNYVSREGKEERPVVIHRTVLGSIERFIGILIEHYGGRFPLWLAPVQVIILTITDKHIPFGEDVFNQLISHSIRTEKDFRNESLRLKIREAQLQKIPYMLVIGDKEVQKGGVSPRHRSGKDLKLLSLNKFISLIEQESQFPN